MTKYKLFGALLTDEQTARIEKHAEEKGVSKAAVLRWAVDAFDPLFLPNDSRSCSIHESDERLVSTQ